MNRRNFIKKTLGTGFFLGTSAYFGNLINAFPVNQSGKSGYNLVAVRGGEPDVMLDRALQSLGGISKFVKKNQTVVIKPNIGWDVVPERGANTHPTLVSRLVKHCLDAGAKKVTIFDNTCDNWKNCYKNSGIEQAAKDAGAQVVPGNSESYYQDVDVPKGIVLKKAKVHELILESDVFINVPILKSHRSARLTIAMKNLMGIVWDRRYWHANNLHQCIADFSTYRKPDLNIVDAYYVMKENGPRGVSEADVQKMKSLIVSPDMLAADVAAAKLFGMEPDDISYIKMADALGVGIKDLNKLSIDRIII